MRGGLLDTVSLLSLSPINLRFMAFHIRPDDLQTLMLLQTNSSSRLLMLGILSTAKLLTSLPPSVMLQSTTSVSWRKWSTEVRHTTRRNPSGTYFLDTSYTDVDLSNPNLLFSSDPFPPFSIAWRASSRSAACLLLNSTKSRSNTTFFGRLQRSHQRRTVTSGELLLSCRPEIA